MSLTDEERCATCGSGDPRKPGQFIGETCADPYHLSAWDDDLCGDLRIVLAELHERAREQNAHLPQYAGYWNGWGLCGSCGGATKPDGTCPICDGGGPY